MDAGLPVCLLAQAHQHHALRLYAGQFAQHDVAARFGLKFGFEDFAQDTTAGPVYLRCQRGQFRV